MWSVEPLHVKLRIACRWVDDCLVMGGGLLGVQRERPHVEWRAGW